MSSFPLGEIEQHVFEREGSLVRVRRRLSPAAILWSLSCLAVMGGMGWRLLEHDEGFFYLWTLLIGGVALALLVAAVSEFFRGPRVLLAIGPEIVKPAWFGLTQRAARGEKVTIGLYQLPLIRTGVNVWGRRRQARDDRRFQLLFLDRQGRSTGISLDFLEASSLEGCAALLKASLPIEVREDRRAEVSEPSPAPFDAGLETGAARRFQAAGFSLAGACVAILLTVDLVLPSKTAIRWGKAHAGNPLVRAWLQSGVRKRMRQDMPLLAEACWLGETELARQLLSAQADIEAKTSKGSTPLALAVMGGHSETAGLLLARGAKVDAPAAEGLSALHWTAGQGSDPEMLKLLLAAGADPRRATPYGSTPLHAAAAAASLSAIEALAKAGADVNAKDSAGRTPLWWARRKGAAKPQERKAAEDLLLSLGASD